MEYIGKNGKYSLASQPMKQGGEGAIYNVTGRNDLVAKIYLKDRVSAELSEKLSFMANNPPDSSILSQIAWPQDVLRDANGNFVGFVMPKLKIDTDLKDIYVYPAKKDLQITYEQKIIIAINICIVISAIHKAGYTFGDFNPMNIGVNLTTGHVAFLDTDSYHIYDKYSRKMYRCGVCLDGYVAPELIKQCKDTDYLSAPLPTFTQETDKFALAIHIFKLLMNGFTPFNGIKETDSVSQASPGLGNKAIEKDNYCFKAGNKPQSVATPDLSAFPPDIQYLFKRAFIDGRDNPENRPSADEWYKALLDYKKNLVQCKRDATHFYYVNDRECPYCAAEERYNLSLGKSSGSQMTFSQPISVPGTSSGTSYGNSTYAPSSSSSTRIGSNTSSYVGSSKQNLSSTYKTNGSFTKKLIGWAIAMGLLLIGIAFICLACVNPVTNIRFTAPSNANAILYGTDLEEIGLQLKSHQIFGGWKDVDFSKADITGYFSTVLGNQTVKVSYEGKTASVKINVVPVDLRTPCISVSDGKLKIDYDTKYTESLIFEINGAEYVEKPTEEYSLPDTFDAGTYTVKVKSVNNNEFINDSVFSDSITVKKLQSISLENISNGILSFEASSESDLYDVYVDGVYYKSITGNEFDLNSIAKVGQHTVTISVKPTDTMQLCSNQSEAISYTMLSNEVSFSVDSGYLTWSPVSNASGYELYVSDMLVSTYGKDIPELDIMSFYSENGYTLITVKALGDGTEYINSGMSDVYRHIFTETYVPLRTVEDLYKLNNSDERYILANDIDLSSIPNWTPIENFSGYLFGNNKTIKNLTINTNGSNIGFFSALSGTVDHLNFENANITVTGSNENVGILCGTLNGSANTINVSGVINAEKSKYVGGIAGYVVVYGDATLSNLENKANISGADYTGGIFGKLYNDYGSSSKITQLSGFVNIGTVTGKTYTGGIIGDCTTKTMLNASEFKNTGDVSGTQYVGGTVGYAYGCNNNDGSYIQDSSCAANIKGEAYVGCIAGKTEGVLINSCTNTGSTLTATKYATEDGVKNAYVGGFAGYCYGANDCINEVVIKYTAGGAYVGGIAGYVAVYGNATMSNLENKANISGADYTGGIFGRLYNNTYNVSSYTVQLSGFVNSGTVSGKTCTGGIIGDCTTKTMLNASEFKNTGDVTGTQYVGGTVGYAYGNNGSYIQDSSCVANIKGEAYVGCIAGKADYVLVNSCTNTGSTLTATKYATEDGVKNAYVGGFAGYCYGANDCINEVVIKYTAGGAYVGGIAGYVAVYGNATLSNLENKANISGADYTGGIFGRLYNNNNTYNVSSYTVQLSGFVNSGTVSGKTCTGGIIGDCTTKTKLYILDFVNKGKVSGSSKIGGIVGYCYGYSGSYIQDSSTTSGNLCGKTENVTIK